MLRIFKVLETFFGSPGIRKYVILIYGTFLITCDVCCIASSPKVGVNFYDSFLEWLKGNFAIYDATIQFTRTLQHFQNKGNFLLL